MRFSQGSAERAIGIPNRVCLRVDPTFQNALDEPACRQAGCGLGNEFLSDSSDPQRRTKAGAYFHTYIVDWDSLSGQGPIISAKRPVRLSASGGDPHDVAVWGGMVNYRPLPDCAEFSFFIRINIRI